MTAETETSPATQPDDQPSRFPRWVVIIAATALGGVVVGVVVYGYVARPGWIGVADKKFWDYLELLIVPAALAIGVYLLNRAQTERQRKAEEAQQERERTAEEAQRERERKAEEERRERDLAVERERAQDEALEAYLDHIGQLLIEKRLREAQLDDDLSVVARARTLLILRRLDAERKRQVLLYLYEAGLINREAPVIDLSHADFEGIDLTVTHLEGAYLRRVNLRRATLVGVSLQKADLFQAELYSADLSLAEMEEAKLAGCQLAGATLKQANLHNADLTHVWAGETYEMHREGRTVGERLRGADLQGAKLEGAQLDGAYLVGTNLRGATVTHEQLEQAWKLESATMPDGQKYEDWLKSNGSGEDGESGGSS
jgi:uncharacterized protein YjbI with pentapeptide repeats